MRISKIGWSVAALAIGLSVGLYMLLLGPLGAWFWGLTDQPAVRVAFQGEGGSTDALLTLVAFFVLTPVAVALLALLLVDVVRIAGLLLRHLRLPEWVGAVTTLPALAVGAYAAHEAWLPALLHLAGLAARAYLVFSAVALE